MDNVQYFRYKNVVTNAETKTVASCCFTSCAKMHVAHSATDSRRSIVTLLLSYIDGIPKIMLTLSETYELSSLYQTRTILVGVEKQSIIQRNVCARTSLHATQAKKNIGNRGRQLFFRLKAGGKCSV